MKYQTYSFSDKEEVNKLLNTDNREDIVSAIIGAVNGIDDWRWLQNLCLKYIKNEDFWIAKTSISALGDIARLHKRIDVEEVRIKLLEIDSDELKVTVEDTLEDIKIFIKN